MSNRILDKVSGATIFRLSDRESLREMKDMEYRALRDLIYILADDYLKTIRPGTEMYNEIRKKLKILKGDIPMPKSPVRS